MDPVGTIFIPGMLYLLSRFGMPLILFGWAKPVPVNFQRLSNPKRDMILVGMAGPAINIFIAVVLSVFIKFNPKLAFNEWMLAVMFINLLLAIFNMMPIPPLDGSRLVMGLLPNRLALPYSRIEPFGIPLVLIAVIYFDIFEKVILPIIEVCGNMLGVKFIGVII